VDEEEKNKKVNITAAEGLDAGMEDQIAAYYAAARANAREDAAQFAAEDADFSEDEPNWEDTGIGADDVTGVSSNISTPASNQATTLVATGAASASGQAMKHDDDDDDDEDEEFEDV